MQRASIYTAALVALVCSVLLYGCDGSSPTLPSPDGGGEPTAVMITPASAQTLDNGQTVAFSATLQFPGGRSEDATDRVTWHWTGDAAVGSVNEDGLFTAGDECGSGSVVASYGDLQDSVEITVRVLTGLTVTPSNALEMIPGQTQQFTATATYCGETNVDSAPQQAATEDVTDEANWSWTAAASVGSVDEDGTFTAGETEGQGQVRASFGGLTASSGTITVINSGDVPINISQREGRNS